MTEEFESLEALVAKRIREQLADGRLDELLKARTESGKRPDFEVQLSGGGHLTVEAKAVASAEVSHPGDVADIAVIEAASQELARDIRGRSPQDINFVINFYVALLQTVQVLLMVYQMVHGEPPSNQQITEIINHTTNVYNHTTNIVVNMPPSHP